MGDKHSEQTISLSFNNSKLLPGLYGEHDKFLTKIEKSLGVVIRCRGNTLSLTGGVEALNTASRVLNNLYGKLEHGVSLESGDVDAALRMEKENGAEPNLFGEKWTDEPFIRTPKRTLHAHSKSQTAYIKALQEKELVFGIGPAGTGKTYIAVAMAVAMFVARKVDRIILSRPAVEAGEKLGFLPGDLKEKIDPYLRPLYDALYDTLPGDRVVKAMETGEIEIAPLAFMRGRTLTNAFVILDEAQNTTPMQMKMFLTRLGENARMVVTGDLTQIDLPNGVRSGLKDASDKLSDVEGIGFIRFKETEVLRHPLTARIVQAYDAWDKKEQKDGNGT